MNPPDNLPVSATEALELTNKTTLSLLTRKPDSDFNLTRKVSI